MQNLFYLLELSFNKKTQLKSIRIGLMVGFLLNIINHGDEIVGEMNIDFLKISLTFLTPYCVSLYSLVSTQANK
jgi:hypothetical protein